MKALVESLNRVGSHVRIGKHELFFDQPESVPGGGDRGPSPLDAMAVSIAACAHYFAAAYLYGRGLPTSDLAVEVETEKDRVPVSRLGRLTLRVHLPAGLSEGQIVGIERAIKGCPAYGTLLHPPKVELILESSPERLVKAG